MISLEIRYIPTNFCNFIFLMPSLNYLHVNAKSYLLLFFYTGSEITPCNKIDKQLVVYRFSGNVMTSITTKCT